MFQPSYEQVQDQIKQIEEKLLADLQTTELFKMKDRFAEYITEYVQLEREGLCNRIKNLEEKIGS